MILHGIQFAEYGTGINGSHVPHPNKPDGWEYGDKGWLNIGDGERKNSKGETIPYFTLGQPAQAEFYKVSEKARERLEKNIKNEIGG